jgi:Na+/melibiose symporter-like transporter
MEQRISEFVSVVRARNVRESLAAVLLIIYFGYRLAMAPEGVHPAGAGIVIVACLFILILAWTVLNIPETDLSRYPPQQHPDHWRKKMTTQAAALKLAWLWYVLPLLGGVALIVVGRGEGWNSTGAMISLVALALIGLFLTMANVSAGKQMERDRDEWFPTAKA